MAKDRRTFFRDKKRVWRLCKSKKEGKCHQRDKTQGVDIRSGQKVWEEREKLRKKVRGRREELCDTADRAR